MRNNYNNGYGYNKNNNAANAVNGILGALFGNGGQRGGHANGNYRNGGQRNGNYQNGGQRNGNYASGGQRGGNYANGGQRGGNYQNGNYRNGTRPSGASQGFSKVPYGTQKAGGHTQTGAARPVQTYVWRVNWYKHNDTHGAIAFTSKMKALMKKAELESDPNIRSVTLQKDFGKGQTSIWHVTWKKRCSREKRVLDEVRFFRPDKYRWETEYYDEKYEMTFTDKEAAMMKMAELRKIDNLHSIKLSEEALTEEE